MEGVGPVVLLMDHSALPSQLRGDDPSWLSDSEQARFHRIGSSVRRLEYLTARFAMRRLLSFICEGTSWQDWSLSYRENSSPAVLRMPAAYKASTLHLSLSHSAGLIAVAVSSTEIGIDIEVQRKRRPVCELIDIVGSEEEVRRLQALMDDAKTCEFYRLWTLKEAYFKRRQTGIDWMLIKSLQTGRVTQKNGENPNAAVWEGVYKAWPYTVAISTSTLSVPPTIYCNGGLQSPESSGWWRVALLSG